ncbi:MAG: Fur family transcriptional regulator [Bacillota bacterium]
MDNLAEWKEKLRVENIRCTTKRIEILRLLIEENKPLTAKEIYNALKEIGVELRLSTIYRTLNIFLEHDLAKKLNLNSEESKFELRGEHHHHLVCVDCNQVVALDCPLQQFGEKLKSETGYKIKDHSIKFYGVCPQCQKSKKRT